MEKILEILWNISKDKEIEHKFNLKSDVSRIIGQEIAI